MGTPTEASWPGISRLPDFKTTFPRWSPVPLDKCCPNLCAKGINLLTKMLQLDPTKRITAEEALEHVIQIIEKWVWNYHLNVFFIGLLLELIEIC